MMKKNFALFFLSFSLAFAVPGSNIEVIDLNITPLENTTNFSPSSSSSITTREGTFIKVSTGEGSGITREEAVKNALIEAIGKMKGFSTADSTEVIKNYSSNSFEQGQVDKKFSQKISKATKGRVDSYEVNRIFMENDGKYGASVSAYKTLFTRNEKPNLALFNTSKYKALGDMLKQRLINDFTKSKRFNVLDRSNEAFYKAEKTLLESEDSSSEEIFKLGNVLGADYMLVYNIRDIGAAKNSSQNITIKNPQQISGDVVVDYRLILFATREIKIANTLSIRINLKDDSVKSNELAMQKIANALSQDVLNEIYPLWVAMVEGKEVLFEEKLELNEIYECSSKIDSNTARVQIISSNSNNSRAKILDGVVRFGDTCKISLDKGKVANYKLDSGGGVILGF